ncbi:MAG: cell division protein SepF [Defluviitaleaceae bacterium]|nr:cell division protein SepF [Defluviitaleaceae bacterium]
MGLVKKVKEWFEHTGERNYDEYEEDVIGEYEYTNYGSDVRHINEGRKGDTVAITPRKSIAKQEEPQQSSVAGFVAPKLELVTSTPKNLEDAAAVADLHKQGKTVLICLADIPFEESVRIVDFLSGVIYNSGGDIKQQTKNRNFIVAPKGVDITEHHQEQLKQSGVNKKLFSRVR